MIVEERFPLLTGEVNDENLSRRIWVELKKNGQISGPSIFSRFAMYSLTVITQAFAGHLSDLDMVAISIASFVIISISFGLLLGMASALETLCGQAYGAKQYHMLGIYLQRSWVVLFFCSILLLPMFVYATPMLKFLGQSTEVAEKAGIVALWFIPFHFSFVFVFPLQRFLQSQLKTSVIAWVSGLVLVLHVFVTWLFVYRFRVGIVGIALTLNFSWWVSVLGMFLYTVLGGCPLTWTGFSVLAFSGLWDFLKLATASGVMLCLENGYYRVLIIASKNLSGSDVVVDALSICITIYGWESMIPLGFFAATGVRVANELGAGNGKGAKFATIVSAVSSLVVGFFFWSMIMVFPKKFAQIFTSSTTVLTAVNKLAGLLSFTILFNCIQPVLSGVAVGSGWQSVVAYINISCYYIIGVPLGILLGWALGFGITGLWVGLIGGTVIQTMILIFMTNRCDWEKELTDRKEERLFYQAINQGFQFRRKWVMKHKKHIFPCWSIECSAPLITKSQPNHAAMFEVPCIPMDHRTTH